ncbi:GFA family protein [Microbulbifer sp. ALW1]|uniref:GFA family protein n=1 Tax=Microbulbifer sp. (strain ALW1) TaxID=1516059 RepID=UPI00135A05C5
MKGSCSCGQVQYQVKCLDSAIQHCSCKTCRKSHAAAFNSAAAVLKENFKWEKGEDNLSGYVSSPGKIRYFCSTCGSHLIAEKEGRPHYILRVATLDEDPGVKPDSVIWRSHEVSWLEYGDHIAAHQEWQPGR